MTILKYSQLKDFKNTPVNSNPTELLKVLQILLNDIPKQLRDARPLPSNASAKTYWVNTRHIHHTWQKGAMFSNKTTENFSYSYSFKITYKRSNGF